MTKSFTFYWHDYETFGTHPGLDRPCQFAGVRTNSELEEIDAPLVEYCQPQADYLPDPGAVLVTGITPQLALEKGLPEYQFAARIQQQFSVPGTCGVGYNSIRFDDEFTRYLLYRNLYDPYAREWRNGGSRWDLIDVVRMTYALRPDGINWPLDENGVPSFRLELLTAANGIGHAEAHDALSDVRATIKLARLLRRAQPRLFDYALGLRDKHAASRMLNIKQRSPVVHISSRYRAAQGCLALVVPLASHPQNKNSVIVWNLAEDPVDLLNDDATSLRERLYKRTEELTEDEIRPALKEVHCNKSPMLVTEKMLSTSVAARHGIDLAACRDHLQTLQATSGIEQKLAEIYSPRSGGRSDDPDLALYSGFIGNADRRRLDDLRGLPAEELGDAVPGFDDARLPELVFRYRARNFPATLSSTEQAEWREHCRIRLADGEPNGALNADESMRRIAAARAEHDDARSATLLDALEQYVIGATGAFAR